MAFQSLFGTLRHLVCCYGDDRAGNLGTAWQLGFPCVIRGDGRVSSSDILRCVVLAGDEVETEVGAGQIMTVRVEDIHIAAQEDLDCGYRFWKEEPIIFNYLFGDTHQVDKRVAENPIVNGSNSRSLYAGSLQAPTYQWVSSCRSE